MVQAVWLSDAKQVDSSNTGLIFKVRLKAGEEQRIKVPGPDAKGMMWVVRLIEPAAGKILACTASRTPLVKATESIPVPKMAAGDDPFAVPGKN